MADVAHGGVFSPTIWDIWGGSSTTGAPFHLLTTLAGEDAAFDTIWGGRFKPTSLTADGQVGAASAGYYYGYIVTTALSAAAINVRDATSSGTGTIVDIIAASSAAGTKNILASPIYCATGIFADFGGTGTVTFYYWQG